MMGGGKDCNFLLHCSPFIMVLKVYKLRSDDLQITQILDTEFYENRQQKWQNYQWIRRF